MAEVGFPGQHTTTTTITSNTTVQTNIRFDPMYIRTAPGILKVVQVISSLLGFICVLAARYDYKGYTSYYSWISMIAFWFTGILLGLYLFHLVEKFYKIPWLRLEFGFCAIWALAYLLAASLVVSVYNNPGYDAAAFFGYAAMFAYAIDAYLKFRGVQAGGLAQGTRVVSKQTASAVASPQREEGY